MGTVRCNRNQRFIFNLLIFLQSLLLIIPDIPTHQRSRDDSSWGKTNISERVFKMLFWCYLQNLISQFNCKCTAWKVSKYEIFSGLYFPAFRLNMEYISVFSPNTQIRARKNCIFGHFSRSGELTYHIDNLNLFRTSLLNVLQINCLVTMIILLTTRNDKTWLQHTRT